jgi:hypothetical protein
MYLRRGEFLGDIMCEINRKSNHKLNKGVKITFGFVLEETKIWWIILLVG